MGRLKGGHFRASSPDPGGDRDFGVLWSFKTSYFIRFLNDSDKTSLKLLVFISISAFGVDDVDCRIRVVGSRRKVAGAPRLRFVRFFNDVRLLNVQRTAGRNTLQLIEKHHSGPKRAIRSFRETYWKNQYRINEQSVKHQ